MLTFFLILGAAICLAIGYAVGRIDTEQDFFERYTFLPPEGPP